MSLCILANTNKLDTPSFHPFPPGQQAKGHVNALAGLERQLERLKYPNLFDVHMTAERCRRK